MTEVVLSSLLLEPNKNGITRPKRVRGTGIKMVNMGELFAYPRIKDIKMDRVPLDEKEKSFLLKKNDLLFARQSLVLEGAGQCSIFLGDKEDVTFESHLIRVRIDERKACPEFIFNYFKSYAGRSNIETIVEQGAGASGIRSSDLSNLILNLPELEYQKKAASLLSLLDEKIEINKQINKSIENFANALFRDWFIDFGPVTANVQGNKPSAMDENTAALFPNSFIDSELGPIPKGWHVGTISEIANLVNGYAFKSSDWVDQGIPVVKIGSVKPGFVDLTQVSFVKDETAALLERFRLTEGDILIGMTGYVGTIGLVPFSEKRPLLNQRVGKFELKDNDEGKAFLYFNLSRQSFKESVEARSHGTAQANVSRDAILSIPIVLPPRPVRQAFNELFSSYLELVLSNFAEINFLEATRNFLLPKLISGEIELKD